MGQRIKGGLVVGVTGGKTFKNRVTKEGILVSESLSVVSDSLQPHGLQSMVFSRLE